MSQILEKAIEIIAEHSEEIVEKIEENAGPVVEKIIDKAGDMIETIAENIQDSDVIEVTGEFLTNVGKKISKFFS